MLFTEMERLAGQVGGGGEQPGGKRRIRISFLDSYIVCFYCGFKFKQSIFFSCGNSFNWLNALTEHTSQNY